MAVIAAIGLAVSVGLIGPQVPITLAATYEIDQVQDVVDELFRIQPNVGSASYNGGAQTVTVGIGGELTAVELFMAREDFTTRDLVVEIRDGSPTGALLATGEPIPAAEVPLEPDAAWILVTFLVRPTLTAGQTIAIVIPWDPPSATSDPAWFWGKAASDVYAGGVAYGGVIGGAWQEYVDGSDLTFVTHMRNGEATCDLAAALEGGGWVDDVLEVGIDETVIIGGFDFPPNEEVSVELAPVDGSPTLATDVADAFGEFEGVVIFEAGDEGTWAIQATATADATCTDGVILEVAGAVAPTPSPTPSPTPAPTPSPTPPAPVETASPAPLPDTAAPTEAGVSGMALAVMGVVLVLGGGMLATVVRPSSAASSAASVRRTGAPPDGRHRHGRL